jgi:hypothetical protein
MEDIKQVMENLGGEKFNPQDLIVAGNTRDNFYLNELLIQEASKRKNKRKGIKTPMER